MKNIESGIYKLTFKPTKEFYIGATKDLYKRWHSHKSHFRAGRNHSPLQTLYDTSKNFDDWTIKLIESCKISQLDKVEQTYLTKYKNDKRCLNTFFTSTKGRRNVAGDQSNKEHLAFSLLGKNTDKGIRRPNNLTFISPEGKEYPHVISVKGFAEEHGLEQVGLNELANGKYYAHFGWTMKGSNLPYASNVIEYWTRERMLQHYPEHTIIGPDGTEYKTFIIFQFEQEHNCKVITEMGNGQRGIKSHARGLDEYGRGYRLSSVPYFKVTINGQTFDNVLSIAKCLEPFGIGDKRLSYLLRRTKDTKRSKKTPVLTIEKIIPTNNS